jgi:hypothetical protein
MPRYLVTLEAEIEAASDSASDIDNALFELENDYGYGVMSIVEIEDED